MFNTQTAIVLIYTAVLACNRLAGASGAALQKTALTEICNTATEMRAVPALAKSKLDKAQGLVTEYHKAALRLQALAAARDNDITQILVIESIAASLGDQAERALEQVKTLTDKALTASAAAGGVYGGISEFLTLTTAGISGTAGGCLSESDNGDVISNKPSNTVCPIDQPITLESQNHQLSDSFGPQGLTTQRTNDAKATGGAATKCVLFAAPGTAATKLFQQATTAAIAGGTLKITGAGPALQTDHTSRISQETGTTGSKLIIQAHTATRQLLAESVGDPAQAVKNKVKELAAQPELATSVAQKLKLIGAPGDQSDLEKQAKEQIKNLLDDGNEKLESKWQALIDTKIYDGKSDEAKTEKASSITFTKELIQSVLYYRNKRQADFLRVQKELEQKKNDCKKKPQKPKCNGKEKTECGTTKGCEWNKTEEKCKLTEDAQKDAEKARQEIGKDGKTTNTTGSNSFVIKRAPLLIAVFLL
uniref:Variant surface glycoprotein 1125.4672 n=1 Tax=Trypanosoma brucei TaxID=5691 RepID=A0A1J0RAS3_9TRYP|nr:variant surface glycoprotein 1125.4672 [Trypanosoma brucei]